MKKDTLISSITVIVIIAIFICVAVYLNTDEAKIKKGYRKFGDEKCSLLSVGNGAGSGVPILLGDEEHPNVGLTVVTKWRCNICGKLDTHGSSPAPKLCNLCSGITNRCETCGKLNIEKEN